LRGFFKEEQLSESKLNSTFRRQEVLLNSFLKELQSKVFESNCIKQFVSMNQRLQGDVQLCEATLRKMMHPESIRAFLDQHSNHRLCETIEQNKLLQALVLEQQDLVKNKDMQLLQAESRISSIHGEIERLVKRL